MNYTPYTFGTVSATGGSSRPLSEVIAERLTQAYLESGRRQRDIGDEAGISQSQISKVLRGVRAPNIDELEAICAALELDVADVVTMAVREVRGYGTG